MEKEEHFVESSGQCRFSDGKENREEGGHQMT
jgi:hypothetical protein